MTALAPGIKKPVPVALVIGLLGGVALSVTEILTTVGPAIYIPYTVLILATLVALRLVNRTEFARRFAAAFLAFMVATLVFYLYIGIFDAGTILKISVWGHVWRLGLMAGIGGILSAVIAYLANFGRAA